MMTTRLFMLICVLSFFITMKAESKSKHPILLKSAAQNGEGPLALPYLRNTVVGSADVFGSEQPDLFVMGNGKTNGLYLFKWLRNNHEGVPVFDTPIKIKDFPSPKASVFQTHDKQIHAIWINDFQIKHALFDRVSFSFILKNTVTIENLVEKPLSASAIINQDGSVDVILEIIGLRKKAKYQNQNPSTFDWRPFDEAGIASTAFNYVSLYVSRFPELLKGRNSTPKLITSTNNRVLSTIINSAPVNFNRHKNVGLITGSRQGVFYYYESISELQNNSLQQKHIVDKKGNILRHPSISASVSAYPVPKENLTHIISGGEGEVYFYRFTGKYSKNGDPIFENPVSVLQENADLYAGTLPVPSSYDWDDDGKIDLIVGNSEGFILFFKNIGTNQAPAFLPGKKIQAGGKDIHIQAGYSGSVQGVNESRWGYVSPTIFDWTGDGLPDIIIGDITGNYSIFINKGTKQAPKFDSAESLYCNGLELHGMWRSRAAIGYFGGRLALAIVDGDDHFHLYWKIDDYNVEDGGKLTLHNGKFIETSAEPAGGTGRCKLSFFDYDSDGLLDLVIGTGRRSAIPDMTTGYPLPVLGKRTLGTPLFMKNVGTENYPVFEYPKPFYHPLVGIIQPGGSHESGAIGTSLGGGNGKNLIVGNEVGRLFLIQGEQIRFMEIDEAIRYLNTPNPLTDKINYLYTK